MNDTVLAIAEAIRQTQDFSKMPILADALEDSGYNNVKVLAQCRDTSLKEIDLHRLLLVILGDPYTVALEYLDDFCNKFENEYWPKYDSEETIIKKTLTYEQLIEAWILEDGLFFGHDIPDYNYKAFNKYMELVTGKPRSEGFNFRCAC